MSASASRASTIFTIAGVTVFGGLLAYAVYFDYKRRNDAEFRRKLKKEKKRVDKDTQAAEPQPISPELLRETLKKLQADELPATPEEKEQYFMNHVGLGEQLALQGPAQYLPAAVAFFKALRVYPSPVELIMIYQKTVSPPIFNLVMEMTNLDVKLRVEGYFDYFPKKSMNVAVLEKPDALRRKYLVAQQDFEPGDVIYSEQPIVAALDKDIQEQGTYCTHCLRLIHKAMAITPESDPLNAVYCSKECQLKSKAESQNFLFGLEPILPAELDNGMAALTQDKRIAAQKKFIEYMNAQEGNSTILLARFVARQIGIETAKLTSSGTTDLGLTEPGADYGVTDHMERLRYIDTKASDEGRVILTALLEATLPGLEQSLPEERHPVYMGKMAYNAYGVCYSGGRDDRPAKGRPEDLERTRTPYGTSRQIGSALYFVSSYLTHSCDPNARPSFSNGTAELHLVAARPIKKGEELTVSYVDATQHEDETPEEARRRRRYELARGWRFKCECARCLADAPEGEEAGDVSVEKDESKTEAAVERVERGEAGMGAAAVVGVGASGVSDTD